ncbi:unnamed protein product [Chrysoparadoxa australica]
MQEKEAERAKAEKKAAKAKAKAASAAVPRPVKHDKVSMSEEDMDEEDRLIVEETKKQGYCYFNRKLGSKEEALLKAEQDKLRSSPSVAVDAGRKGLSPGPAGAAQSPTKSGGSAWNKGTTWEEVDKSKWVKDRLEVVLNGVEIVSGGEDDPKALLDQIQDFDFEGAGQEGKEGMEKIAGLGAKLSKVTAKVTKAESLTAEACIVFSMGKKRCNFDFCTDLSVDIEVDASIGADESAPKSYGCKLVLTDITNADADNGFVEAHTAIRKIPQRAWPATYDERVKEALNLLKEAVLERVRKFYVDEYKAQ